MILSRHSVPCRVGERSCDQGRPTGGGRRSTDAGTMRTSEKCRFKVVGAEGKECGGGYEPLRDVWLWTRWRRGRWKVGKACVFVDMKSSAPVGYGKGSKESAEGDYSG